MSSTPHESLSETPAEHGHAQGHGRPVGNGGSPAGRRRRGSGVEGAAEKPVQEEIPSLPNPGQETPLPQQYHQDDQPPTESHIDKEGKGAPQSQPGAQGRTGLDVTGPHAPQQIGPQQQAKAQPQPRQPVQETRETVIA